MNHFFSKYLFIVFFAFIAAIALKTNPVTPTYFLPLVNKPIPDKTGMDADTIKTNSILFSGNKIPKEISITYSPDITYAFIGVSDQRPVDNPYDNIFHVNISSLPRRDHIAFLQYDLSGVSAHSGISRSINDAQAIGGQIAHLSQRWTTQKEAVPLSQLKKGDNVIRFGLPKGVNYHYQIKNFHVIIEKRNNLKPALLVSHASFYDNQGYLKGMVQLADSKHPETIQLFFNDQAIPVFSGEFETLVPVTNHGNDNFSGELKAILASGEIILQKINFTNDNTSGIINNLAAKGFKKEGVYESSNGLSMLPSKSQSFAGIHILPKTLPRNTAISITALRDVDVPVLNTDLVNVTKGATAYRFLPHGTKFNQPVQVQIPFDSTLIPDGYTAADIRSYFFDEKKRQWEELQLDTVLTEKELVASATLHFTDMINGIIKVPESPQTQGYTPTSIKDIKAANPSAGIELINPPTANNMGNATMSFNIKLPAGRLGIQPHLSVQYNNEGENSWMGLGWDLSLPFIGIDTRWGAPRYNTALETETYTMAGAQLAPIAHKGSLVARTAEKQFHPRVEGRFNKIIRHGNSPNNYWWEVTDKNGIRSFFGGHPSVGIVNSAVLKDDNGNIGYWALVASTDLNDNTVHYRYVMVQDVGLASGTVLGKQLYIDEIDYTGIGSTPGPYTVKFTRDRQLGEARRKDVDISGRLGFKMVTADLLRKVTISLNGQPIRSYDLQYREGAFYKTLLKSVTELDAAGVVFYSHNLDYYDDVRSQAGYAPLGNTEDWSPANDNIKSDIKRNLPGFSPQASALSTAKSKNSSRNLAITFGLWNFLFNKSLTVGGSFGSGNSSTEGLVSLIDVNGDGLPDKLLKKGGRLSYRPNSGDSLKQFGNLRPVSGINNFSAGNSNSNSVGLEVNALIAFLGRNSTTTTTNTNYYFGDYNGDGLIDIVNNGQVYFNRLNNNGDPVYLPTSNQTPSPVLLGGNVNPKFLAPDTALQHEQERNFPLQDIVRLWVAPFNGNITVTAPLNLLNTGTNPKADGVRASIQLSGNVLWSTQIAATDFSVKTPTGISNLNVTKGQRLYFRIQSVYNGDKDLVNWSPIIKYNNVITPARDANKRPTDQYKASEDFVLSYEGSAVLGKSGTITIDGNFSKSTVSDSVKLVVERDHAGIHSILFQKEYPANSTINEPVLVPSLAVDSADQLFFRLYSDSYIDRTVVKWKPRYQYTSFTDGTPVLDQNGNPVIEQFVTPDNSNYNDWMVVTPLLTNEQPDIISIKPFITADPAVSGTVNFTVKGTNTIYGKRKLQLVNGAVSGLVDSIPLIRQPNDTLYCEYHIANRGTADSLLNIQFIKQNADATKDTLPAGLYSNPKENYLGTLYRGWGHFSFKGSTINAPLDETKINVNNLPGFSNDPNLYLDSSRFNTIIDASLTEFVPMFADNQRGEWVGFDSSVYLNGTQMSSARLWMHDVSVDSLMVTAGASLTAVNKVSRTNTTSYALGLDPDFGFFGARISTSISNANTTNLLDMMDMNGDRYPDVMHINQIQYTLPNGGLENSSRPHNQGAADFEGKSKGITLGGTFIKALAKNTPSFNASNTTDNAGAAIGLSLSVNGSLNKNDDEVVSTWMDINGDGLPDKIYKNGFAALNLGYKFAPPENWGAISIEKNKTSETSAGGGLGINIWFGSIQQGFSVTRAESDCSTSFEDVNGDGLVDKLIFNGGSLLVQLNAGNGFGPAIAWAGLNSIRSNASVGESSNTAFSIVIPIFIFPFPVPVFKLVINPSFAFGEGVSRDKDRIMDINGDGFADLLHSENDGQLLAKRSTIGRTNMVRRIERPMGSYFTIDYERIGNTYELPQSKWVLMNTELFDGVRGDGVDTLRNSFKYSGGFYDRDEREFYGFRMVNSKQLNTAAGNVVYRTQVNKYLNSNYYNKGLTDQEWLQDAAGNKYTQTNNKYEFRAVQDSVKFPALVQTDNLFYEGNAAAGVTTSTQFDYDALGNMTLIRDAGDGSAQDMITARITYHNNSTLYIKGIVSGIEVTTIEGLKRKRETDINNKGQITQIRQLLEANTAARYDMEYDTRGNLLKMIRPLNNRNQRLWHRFTYDSITQTYTIKIEDAYGYSSSSSYDLRFGEILSTLSMQGQPLRYKLDDKGRVSTITGPYEIAAGKPYTIAFDYHPEATVPYATTRHHDPEYNADINTVTFMDGLGRTLQVKKQAAIFKGKNLPDDVKMIVSGRVFYDAFGRTIETRYPITEDMGVNNNAFNLTTGKPMATSAYDVLDRNLNTVLADGSTTANEYTISGGFFSTLTKDALQNTKELLNDVRNRNRIVNVFGGPNGPIATKFTYNALSELLAATDAGGNAITYTYDNLGRKLSVGHPDAGLTSFVYDLAGNMTKKITAQIKSEIPNGGAINYGYEFERLVDIDYPRQYQNKVKYTYGKPGMGNRTGRLILQEDASGGQEFYYGKLGEVTKTIRTMLVNKVFYTTYVSEQEYDTWNRLKKMTYPDGEVVKYYYNRGGSLNSISGDKLGNQYKYVSQLGYDEFEQRIYLQYGNGTENRYAYDAQRRRLSHLQSLTATGKLFMNNDYRYDAVSNILGIENNIQAQPGKLGGYSKQQYSYDNLYRLTAAKGAYKGIGDSSTYQLDMAYDNLYNITHKKMIQSGFNRSYDYSYSYTGSKPHQPSKIALVDYTYDLNGNQLKYGDRQYFWDEDNRQMATIEKGLLSLYTYDAGGERAVKSSGGLQGTWVNGAPAGLVNHHNNYTAYISPYLVARRTGFTKHYYIESQRIVSKTGIGNFTNISFSIPAITAGGIDYLKRMAELQKQRYSHYASLGISPGPPTDKYFYAHPYNRGIAAPILVDSTSSSIPPGWPGNTTPPPIGPPIFVNPIPTNDSVKAGYGFTATGHFYEKNQYFYHPDHLGSTAYVTDALGEVSQHQEYAAFGETFFDEHVNTPATPFLYNAKEKDAETGLYYYGARYYDPRISTWISVDPLAEKYPGMSGYNYCGNNPVICIDPDGREKIVVTGGEYDARKFKYDFVEPSITQLGAYKGNAGSEKITWIVMDKGYSDGDKVTFNAVARAYGATFVLLNTAGELITYINTQTTPGSTDNRKKDQITAMSFFGHGLDGSMEFGYGQSNPEILALKNNDIASLDPGAFNKANIDIYTCNAATPTEGTDASTSFAAQLAKQTRSQVTGYLGKTDYEKINAGPLWSLKKIQGALNRKATTMGFNPYGSLNLPTSGTQADGKPSIRLIFDERQ